MNNITRNTANKDSVLEAVKCIVIGSTGLIFGLGLVEFLFPNISPWWGAPLGLISLWIYLSKNKPGGHLILDGQGWLPEARSTGGMVFLGGMGSLPNPYGPDEGVEALLSELDGKQFLHCFGQTGGGMTHNTATSPFVHGQIATGMTASNMRTTAKEWIEKR